MEINKRIGSLIDSYGAAYDANNLTDEKARKLITEFVNIQRAEADLQAFYAAKLSKVLPSNILL